MLENAIEVIVMFKVFKLDSKIEINVECKILDLRIKLIQD